MKNISVEKIVASPDNPEERYQGAAFAELVASVVEKGVLMPILVRERVTGTGRHDDRRRGTGTYEVIAGNRRLMAAREARFKEIPARVVEMTDAEAREARIVENLQREDVHPLDEAASYRDLIEKSKPRYEIADVAVKVGKSERYVRDRLALNELDAKACDAARAGELPLSHAVVIARLPKKDQKAALEFCDRRDMPTLSDLKEHIAKNVYTAAMKAPPWKDDAGAKTEIAKAIGVEGNEKNLFGESAIESFDDPKQYALATAAWITLKRNEYKAAGKPLTLVSGNYGTSTKGVLSRSDYDTGKGNYASKTKVCEGLHDALVVEGDGIGKLLKICTDKKCPAHHYIWKDESPAGKEELKAKRKKEIAAEKKKREKDSAGMAAAVKKVSWPLIEKHLDALLALALRRANHDVHQGLCKRREIEPVVVKDRWGSHRSYEKAIAAAADGMTPKEKAGLLFELLVPGYSPNYNEGRASAFKKL